ncbi:hypothetical protein HG15A2_04600 [Adhaeretor mobilis]|uniref:Uncharacterized protein n=1 Tax=Adhaeretor mobilis TaxID=1930276 RepID=A0A517MQN7_9BACT|nr:hypothetical protein HG15A2_04600 [Adhaeretor mobilis]
MHIDALISHEQHLDAAVAQWTKQRLESRWPAPFNRTHSLSDILLSLRLSY